MTEHRITAYTKDGIWLLGTIDDDPFQAKVCDEASGFGINGGRVIKLHVGGISYDNEQIAYERGWDKYPDTAKDQALLDALLLFCASLPEQDVWRQILREPKMFLVVDDEVLEWEDP